MRVRTQVFTFIAVAVLAVAFARTAAAEDPNSAFGGKVILSTKSFPSQSKSATAYTQAIRKLSTTNFYEDKATHTWKIYFAAFLKTPLNDVEYIVKLYDVSNGKGQQLITTFDQYTDLRGQKSILSTMKLDKEQVGVNKEILVTLENKGKVLASGRFKILGEGEHFNGKVNFSDDDAQKGSGDGD